MSQKSAKSAAELESMIMAELREHPECESAGVVVIRPTGLAWDAVLVREGAQPNDPCETKLAEIIERLRQRLLELRAYLNAVLKDKSCLIVGSAPGGTVPALHDSGPCICANGSIFTAQKFGISCPDMLVFSGYTTVRSEVGGILSWRRPETIEVLRGGRVKDLIFIESGSTIDHWRTVLDDIDFKYDRSFPISLLERAAIIGEVCGEKLEGAIKDFQWECSRYRLLFGLELDQ